VPCLAVASASAAVAYPAYASAGGPAAVATARVRIVIPSAIVRIAITATVATSANIEGSLIGIDSSLPDVQPHNAADVSHGFLQLKLTGH
jgi:hypothetical protein